MALSFLDCYELLDVREGSDWSDIRKRYKSLIQQCHPDRFLDNPEDLLRAEKTIRQYNAAFKKISDYYQANKILPPRSDNIDNISKLQHEPRKKRPPVDHVDPNHKKVNQSKNSNLGTIKFSIITVAIFCLILFIVYQLEVTPPKTATPTAVVVEKNSQLVPSIQISQSKAELQDPIQPTDIIKYFSIGSGIGEVILSQGGPTHIEDNIWYYGKSTVTFKEGVVADWYRHPDFPLNVEIKNTKEYKSKFLDLKKESKPNGPYWNHDRELPGPFAK